MKKWDIKNNFKFQISNFKLDKFTKILLENRGLKTKKEIDAFLNPRLENVTVDSVDIDKKQLAKVLKRIEKSIKDKEQIVVFGDYDVDGICGTAILWETLHNLGARVMPYIPHRVDEGYGLSKKGISNVKSEMPDVKLIITVDNGIVASEAVEYAKKKGIDVIITDHHVPSKKLPKAYAIVHTTKLCGTGVAYLLSKVLRHIPRNEDDEHLELVALATIADLVPLREANRVLTKYGLSALAKTKRLGLLELFKEAALDASVIGVYHVGHIIAPRLNAMGRMEYAMGSLRLLCTKSSDRAVKLAWKLGQTNRERQMLTKDSFLQAKTKITTSSKLIFISGESFQQGVIGLIAGRIVEEFYRPAIVVSVGTPYSKASARSIHGFNIIEFIRTASDLLVDAGGHPMAAGFTVETTKLEELQEKLEQSAEQLVTEELMVRTLRVECELSFSAISMEMYQTIQQLAPFGMGNPEPVFVTRDVIVSDVRVIGKEKNHLKLKLSSDSKTIDAIGFGLGNDALHIHPAEKVDVAYTISIDTWSGANRLQLKVKDIIRNTEF